MSKFQLSTTIAHYANAAIPSKILKEAVTNPRPTLTLQSGDLVRYAYFKQKPKQDSDAVTRGGCVESDNGGGWGWRQERWSKVLKWSVVEEC